MKLLEKVHNSRIHEILFYVFLFLIPIQTKILYNPGSAYISWYFDYHLAFFVYLTDLILIACFITWIIFDKPKFKNLNTRLFWLILAFFTLSLISLFHVKRLDLGLYQAFKYFELFLLTIYVWQTFKKHSQFLLASSLIFVSGVAQAVIGLWQFHVQHGLGLGFLGEYIAPMGTSGLSTIDISTGKFIRAYGTMPHPNILGGFLVFGLLMGFFLVSSVFAKAPAFVETSAGKSTDRRAAKTTKVIISIGLVVILLGIFVSFSRVAWISAILASLLFTAYYLLIKQKRNALFIVAILVVSCGTVYLAFNPFLKARGVELQSASSTDRAFFNTLGIDLILHHPILGTGVGNYIQVLNDTYPLEPWQNQPPHNIFIFFTAELGILAGIVFLLIIFETLYLARVPRLPDPQAGGTLWLAIMLTGLIFILAANFDHYFATIQQGRLMFFTILGLIAALPNLNAQELH